VPPRDRAQQRLEQQLADHHRLGQVAAIGLVGVQLTDEPDLLPASAGRGAAGVEAVALDRAPAPGARHPVVRRRQPATTSSNTASRSVDDQRSSGSSQSSPSRRPWAASPIARGWTGSSAPSGPPAPAPVVAERVEHVGERVVDGPEQPAELDQRGAGPALPDVAAQRLEQPSSSDGRIAAASLASGLASATRRRSARPPTSASSPTNGRVTASWNPAASARRGLALGALRAGSAPGDRTAGTVVGMRS
jgi:hypothetical protein